MYKDRAVLNSRESLRQVWLSLNTCAPCFSLGRKEFQFNFALLF